MTVYDERIDTGLLAAMQKFAVGKPDHALPLIIDAVTCGDRTASCIYAQILAFQNQWADVTDNCSELLLVPPNKERSYDSYLNMWRLLALAADQTGDWSEANEICAKVANNYQSENYAVNHPLVEMLDAFTAYINACGVGARPYVTFPNLATHNTDCARYFDMLKSFHEYTAEYHRAWSDPALSDLDVIDDLYSAAVDYGLSKEAVTCYENCKVIPRGYNQRLFLARALALAGRRSQAALMFEQAIAVYVGDGFGDILPVAAIWDDACQKLVSALRFDQVMHALASRPECLEPPTPAQRTTERSLRAEQASFVDLKRWENQLRGEPKNSDLRAQVMIAYKGRIKRYRDCTDWHAEHVLWLLTYDTASYLLSESFSSLESCKPEIKEQIEELLFSLYQKQIVSAKVRRAVLGI